jgi:two-component system, LytTR family, response regulator
MKALIVEDEPLARRTLRSFLAEETDIELVGEATDGLSALEAIDRLTPDLVFLDVRLPELSGLEVLTLARHSPAVVFTTAFDRYAVAAFEHEAVDYLVKPFGRRRFRETLERVRRRVPAERTAASTSRLGEGLVERPLRRLFARAKGRIVQIPIEDVERIEGAGDYSEVHCASERYLVDLRLKTLDERLDDERFLRVHRSHIVNLDQIGEIYARDPHRLELRMASGAMVPASRSGSTRLRERMKR